MKHCYDASALLQFQLELRLPLKGPSAIYNVEDIEHEVVRLPGDLTTATGEHDNASTSNLSPSIVIEYDFVGDDFRLRVKAQPSKNSSRGKFVFFC